MFEARLNEHEAEAQAAAAAVAAALQAYGPTLDAEPDGCVPGILGLDAYRHAAARFELSRVAARHVLMDLEPVAVVRCDVVAEGSHSPHDIRRAARDQEPFLAADSAASNDLRLASAHQRVHVKEAQPVQRDAAQEAVVQRALDQIGEACLACGQQQPPVPHDATDGRARLTVGALARQLVCVTKRLAIVTRPEPSGEIQLVGDHVLPLP